MNELAQPFNEGAGLAECNGSTRNDLFEVIETIKQFLFVKCDAYTTHLDHPAGGGKLMLVAVFTETGSLRHDKYGFAVVKCGEDGSHPGMADDDAGVYKALLEDGRGKKFGVGKTRFPATNPDLGEEIGATALIRPAVNDPYHAVERLVGSNCNKDHI